MRLGNAFRGGSKPLLRNVSNTYILPTSVPPSNLAIRESLHRVSPFSERICVRSRHCDTIHPVISTICYIRLHGHRRSELTSRSHFASRVNRFLTSLYTHQPEGYHDTMPDLKAQSIQRVIYSARTFRYSSLKRSLSASITDASSCSDSNISFLFASKLLRLTLPSSKALDKST